MSDALHVAVLLAAGQGLRFGGDRPKQYQLVGSEPLLRRSVRVFADYGKIGSIIVVVPKGGMAVAEQVLGAFAGKVRLVEGGATRQQSALIGLRECQSLEHFQQKWTPVLRRKMRKNKELEQFTEPGEVKTALAPDYVHIHDAARPFPSHHLLDKIISALTPQSGIVPALAVADTLKKANETGEIVATVDRQGLYRAQTPQSFPFAAILAAHEQAWQQGRDDFTDDASIAEYYGLPCKLIEGEASNIKITQPQDLEQANKMNNPSSFPDLRTGNGYDVHALEAGEGVILCGIMIAHHSKLSGHSDADVALHALTDALLATMGAGDIGTHFPPSDPQWRGASSHIFVEHALELIRARGGRLVNIDITLIAEAPKITPRRAAMVARLAEILQLEAQRISVKATTNERLGFIGREEGIAAIATANVLYPGEVPAWEVGENGN